MQNPKQIKWNISSQNWFPAQKSQTKVMNQDWENANNGSNPLTHQPKHTNPKPQQKNRAQTSSNSPPNRDGFAVRTNNPKIAKQIQKSGQRNTENRHNPLTQQ